MNAVKFLIQRRLRTAGLHWTRPAMGAAHWQCARLVTVCNEKRPEAEGEIVASNEALSAASFGVLDAGGLVVPFGDYPQTVLLTGLARRKAAAAAGVRIDPDGRAVVIQRVDAEAANAMAAELGSLLGRARRIFAGAPIYNGHPFHPDPARRADYQDKRAYGWIKGIEAGADAMTLVPSYNSLGTEAVNDAQLAYHSPEWSMAFVGVENGVGVYRPVRLRSTGLTNEPNIPVPALVAANEEQGLIAIQPKTFAPQTSDGRADLPSPNLLLGNPLPERPNEVWAGDLCFVPPHGTHCCAAACGWLPRPVPSSPVARSGSIWPSSSACAPGVSSAGRWLSTCAVILLLMPCSRGLEHSRTLPRHASFQTDSHRQPGMHPLPG